MRGKGIICYQFWLSLILQGSFRALLPALGKITGQSCSQPSLSEGHSIAFNSQDLRAFWELQIQQPQDVQATEDNSTIWSLEAKKQNNPKPTTVGGKAHRNDSEESEQLERISAVSAKVGIPVLQMS